MDLGLEGKVALVTGVSQGIGLACATSLLAEGARVLGTSRSAPPAVDGLTHLQLDMTKPGAAERAVDETVARLGSLDILVNNVGSGRLSTGFADESDAHWAEVFELNLMTAIRTTRAALPHLVEGGGVVVNVSSVNGHLPSTSIYSYSAGKAAMDNLTVGLSHEFARHGVRVVGVAPGRSARLCGSAPRVSPRPWPRAPDRTPQKVVDEAIAEIPIGRFTTPEEVGDLVAFLASERAGTITGTTIRIDGGITPSVSAPRVQLLVWRAFVLSNARPAAAASQPARSAPGSSAPLRGQRGTRRRTRRLHRACRSRSIGCTAACTTSSPLAASAPALPSLTQTTS